MSYLGRSCGCVKLSHSFKGEQKGAQSKTVNRKKSAEAIVPEKGRAEQFAVVEYNEKTGQSQPECVNEESIGVSEREPQNRRLIVYERGGKTEWSF